MSVIASKRNVAKTQYIFTFFDLSKYTEERIKKVPKRKYRWLAQDIIATMHLIESYLMQIENDYYKYGIKLKDKAGQAQTVIETFESLQKPLLALWNIEKYPEDMMIKWSEQINDEIRQLCRMSGIEPYEPMFILDYGAVKRVEFMAKICELHRLIYSKTISLPYVFRETKGSQLMKLADEALFRISRANVKAPTTKELYEKRKEDLSVAVQCLKDMQLPAFSLFALMYYSEENMTKIAELLTDEIKLVNGLMKSDEKRFGSLS